MRLIDADALMEKVCGNCHRTDCVPDATDTVYGCMFADSVEEAPTIKPEVRRGRWIEVTNHRDENGTILTDYECSECCAMVKDSDAEEIESERFCYNCGTQMDAYKIAERRAAADDYAEY